MVKIDNTQCMLDIKNVELKLLRRLEALAKNDEIDERTILISEVHPGLKAREVKELQLFMAFNYQEFEINKDYLVHKAKPGNKIYRED